MVLGFLFKKKGQLAISIDQPAVYSGQNISGKILLSIFQPCDASSLQVVLYGEEYSHVRYSTGSGKERKTKHAYARRSLLYVVIDLATFPDGSVKAGNYEYPFVAAMPEGLPSTMFATGGGGDCKLHYGLKARLHRPGFFSWDIKAACPINVSSAPLPTEPVPVFAAPATTEVNFCCCFNQGRMTMGAYASDTMLHRGEESFLAIALKNESSAKVESVTVEIREFVRWSARGRSNSCIRVVAANTFDPSTIEGCETIDKGAMKAAKEDSNSRASVLAEVHAKLLSCAQRTALSTAHDARDTYCGSVVQCEHDMHVRTATPMCITDPEVYIPIRVGAPPILGMAAPTTLAGTLVPSTPAADGGVTYQLTRLTELHQRGILSATEFEAAKAKVLLISPPNAAEMMATTATTTTTTTTTMTTIIPPTAVPIMQLPEAMPLDADEHASVQFAQALPADWAGTAIVAEATLLPMSNAVIGGIALDGDGLDDGEQAGGSERILMAQAAQAAQPAGPAPGTIEALHRVMESTFDDLRAIVDLLRGEQRAVWTALFASFTPEQFGWVVGQVNMRSTQPMVAHVIGGTLSSGVTSAHCAAALRACDLSYRVNVLKKLVPLVVDLDSGRPLIEATLSEWERVVTMADLAVTQSV